MARSDRTSSSSPSERLLADNRKASHDYHFLEVMEAGVALLGTEVKSIREGRVNLRDSYGRVEGGEVFLHNVHISAYIRKLIGRVVEKGLTLVPIRMYLKNGRVKVALAVARGKQAHDKRETIKRREADRETRAAMKAARR
jgi:SsrA-binding protein